MTSRRSLAALAALAATTLAPAAHADWTGKGELGYVLTRGNSDSSALNAKVDMTEKADNWTHTLGFAALRATTSGVTSANRYELHGQSNLKLSERSYVFGGLRYENDKFSGFDYQAVASGGYGYKVWDTPDTKLATELGVGYRRLKVRLTDVQEGDAIVRGAVNYEHAFNASTKLIDKLLVESGSNDTAASNDLALQVKMSDRLAVSLDYTIRHNTQVASAAIKKTDQLMTANIVFSF